MIAIALEVALAFDLVCSGTVRTGPVGLAMPEASGDPIELTYRVDVDGRMWCSDACDETERLDSVFEGVIVLRDRHLATGSSVIMISPADGRFSDTRIDAGIDGNIATLASGVCRVAPFTGFPDRTV
jgi:hypothetical protein